MEETEFKINEYLSLKLEGENTNLYVNGWPFMQCKYLAFSVPLYEIEEYDEANSIDELEGRDRSEVYETLDITPEVEFWGHCSNLQAWAENDYDSRLLHRNLAFPLLRELVEAGDPLAKKAFKDEIARRLVSGHPTVVNYLLEEGYIAYLSAEELHSLDIQVVEISGISIFVANNILNLRDGRVKDLLEVKGLFELASLEMLDVCCNRLTTLPESIGNLSSLKILNLEVNTLTTLPESLDILRSRGAKIIW
ncbi:MAG: hypothetical protein ACFFAS_02590 [Promethearchaeota archaeon]